MKMKTKVIVIGGKGTAVNVAEQIIDAADRGLDIEFLGFAFDEPSFNGSINGLPILCGTKEVYAKYGSMNDVSFIFQMYRTDLMKERVILKESYGIPLEKYHTFVHPNAVVSRSVQLGKGCVVLAGSVIMPNAVLGDFNSVLSCCTIGHDTVLGDHNLFATHVAMGSGCRIGDRNFFGMNCTINTRAVIGDDCFVGMASNVIRDLPSSSKVKGNPAKEYDGPVKPL